MNDIRLAKAMKYAGLLLTQLKKKINKKNTFERCSKYKHACSYLNPFGLIHIFCCVFIIQLNFVLEL